MTAREQRTIRFGIAGGVLILAYVLLIDPYLSARVEARARIDEREAQFGRLVALERSLPAYGQRLEAANATWDREIVPRLLPSDIPAVAASALSEEVRRIAAQSFLEVERENVLPSSEDAGLTSVPVQFSLRGDIYGLRDFLAAIESSESFLNLREVRVTAMSGGFTQRAISRAAPLQVTVTVEGYLGGGPLSVEPPGTEAPSGAPPGDAAGTDAAGMPTAQGAAGAMPAGPAPAATPAPATGLSGPPAGTGAAIAPGGTGSQAPPGAVTGPQSPAPAPAAQRDSGARPGAVGP